MPMPSTDEPCAYCGHPPHMAGECRMAVRRGIPLKCRCRINMSHHQERARIEKELAEGRVVQVTEDDGKVRRTSISDPEMDEASALTRDDLIRMFREGGLAELREPVLRGVNRYQGNDGLGPDWPADSDEPGLIADLVMVELAGWIAEYLSRQPAPILGVIRPPEPDGPTYPGLGEGRLGLPPEWTDPDAPFDWSARRAQEAAAEDDLSES